MHNLAKLEYSPILSLKEKNFYSSRHKQSDTKQMVARPPKDRVARLILGHEGKIGGPGNSGSCADDSGHLPKIGRAG